MGSRPPQSQVVAQPSAPRSAASTTSSQRSAFGRINKKYILIPTLGCLLFVYGVTSINAAKANAQRHKDVDTGGEGLSLLNESRRRHGMDKRLQGSGNTITELASEARSQLTGSKKKDDDASKEQTTGASGSGRSETEERLREFKGTRPRGREG